MAKLEVLEELGFSLDRENYSNSGALRFSGDHVGYYDGRNGGKVTIIENCPTNGGLGFDYIQSVEHYIRALEILKKAKIPFTGPDLAEIVSALQSTRAAINGFEARIQDLRAKK